MCQLRITASSAQPAFSSPPQPQQHHGQRHVARGKSAIISLDYPLAACRPLI